MIMTDHSQVAHFNGKRIAHLKSTRNNNQMERDNQKRQKEKKKLLLNNGRHIGWGRNTYPLDFLQLRFGRFFHFFQRSPVRIVLFFAPFGVLTLLQHSTEVHTAGICNSCTQITKSCSLTSDQIIGNNDDCRSKTQSRQWVDTSLNST